MYFNTGLVRNLGHLIVFLELWAHLFQENLGTRRLATKSEGTMGRTALGNSLDWGEGESACTVIHGIQSFQKKADGLYLKTLEYFSLPVD